LDVREPGAVLKVQQSALLAMDRYEVGAAGELVVLVRLIEAHLISEPAKMRGVSPRASASRT
nr:hypothetical protein [Chloroflexota bacterium]